jgi:hypothetical protein
MFHTDFGASAISNARRLRRCFLLRGSESRGSGNFSSSPRREEYLLVALTGIQQLRIGSRGSCM